MAREVDMVVFDMDGVLVSLDRPRRLRLLSNMTGRDPAALCSAIWDSDFEPAAEAGAYATGDAYLAEFNRRTRSSLRREQWVEARRAAMTLDPEALRIAAALRSDCQIAMLTNNGALLLEALPDLLPELYRVFGDRAHASCQFNARKPQPEVFQRLLQRHGVAAARAVFIDDCEAFVIGARRIGMRAIRYTGAPELQGQLKQLGLLAQTR